MAEDHSKYMPHHPKPKSAKTGAKFALQDPMLRARTEPTGHQPGQGGPMGDYASEQTAESTMSPSGDYYGGSPAAEG